MTPFDVLLPTGEVYSHGAVRSRGEATPLVDLMTSDIMAAARSIALAEEDGVITTEAGDQIIADAPEALRPLLSALVTELRAADIQRQRTPDLAATAPTLRS